MTLDAPADLMRRSALRYAEEGWGVIPLHTPRDGVCDCRKGTDCESPGKHPWTRNGLKDASTDLGVVDAWWRAHPGANIGLVLPRDIVAVDIDSPDALDNFEAHPDWELPDTWNVTTGKGWHYIYRSADPIKGTVGIMPGIDLRGYGNYLVAPPSLHYSGVLYRQNSSMTRISAAPAWITNGHAAAAPSEAVDDGPIGQGKRNATLTALAGAMRRQGSGEAVILTALRAENEARCIPLLLDEELAIIAHSVARYAPEPDGARIHLLTDLETEAPSWRTLAEISDHPPAELLLGMLEPDGPTLLYALGGVGKGSTGAWILGQLIAKGLHPMVYDAENRPKEWARRTAGLGIDRSQVVYLQPSDLPKKLVGKPLWDLADYLGKVVDEAGVDALLVDSIMPAVSLGEERLRSDAQVPYLWVQALDALGIPSVSFGHPPKGQPEGEPFGSVAWTNAMRLTWNGTTAEGNLHRVRWRPRKRNERGHIAGVMLTFEYGDDSRLSAVLREDDDENTRDWIMAALAGGQRSVADMAEDMLGEMDQSPPGELERIKERIGRSCRRMMGEGWLDKLGKSGRSVQWALKVR